MADCGDFDCELWAALSPILGQFWPFLPIFFLYLSTTCLVSCLFLWLLSYDFFGLDFCKYRNKKRFFRKIFQ